MVMMVLTSCVSDIREELDGNPELGLVEVAISSMAKVKNSSRSSDFTRADEGNVGDLYDPENEDNYPLVGELQEDGSIDYSNWDIDELTPYSIDFDENSVIQVSQKTRFKNPFETPETTYDFAYVSGREDASWENENSFNFTAVESDNTLDWNKIGENGSWNGGFGLFSLYFPIENTPRQRTDDEGAIRYSVMQDQSTLDNLKKSDILGAYHTSSKLFSRVRFRLFHLMTYLRVRLYVPVYKDELHTGYRENALEYATLNNVTPEFIIDWDIARSSDTQGPVLKALDGEDEIRMYQHPIEGGHKIMKIKFNDFLINGYFDQGLGEGVEYDHVRVYDFSVLIPVQKGMLNEDGQKGNFADTEFLNFYFRTNSGAITRYYFKQEQSANNTQSSLELNQGVYQYLQLYLPRIGNQAVCVSSSVNPWLEMGSDMLLTPEENEQ